MWHRGIATLLLRPHAGTMKQPMSAQTTTESQPEDLTQILYLMPVAVARFGEAGALEMLNPAAARLLRNLDIDAAGTDLPTILERLASGLSEAWRASAGRGGAVLPAQQCTVLPAKGPTVHLLLRVFRPGARCTVITLDDVTVTVEKERELERQRRRMGLVFEYIHGYCVAMLDAAGTVMEWNPSIERLFGLTADAIVGQPLLNRVSVHLESPTSSSNFIDVKNAIANEGPRMKRIRPAPMGRAFRYQRRLAHIIVTVAEKKSPSAAVKGDAEVPAAKKKSTKPAAKKTAAKKAPAKKAAKKAAK